MHAKEHFIEFLAKGRNKNRRRIANNTWVEHGDTIKIILHKTVIMEFDEDHVILNSGGYRTSTTKNRINKYLPPGYSIYTKNREWYLTHDNKKCDYVFKDGIRITRKGAENTGNINDVRKREKLAKQIRKYCKLADEQLKQDKVPDPDAGDCWYCHLRQVNTRTPLGELIKDASHLLSHMQEEYVVPSLIWRAIEVRGYPDPSLIWYMRKSQAQFIARDLRRYLYYQFGLGNHTLKGTQNYY